MRARHIGIVGLCVAVMFASAAFARNVATTNSTPVRTIPSPSLSLDSPLRQTTLNATATASTTQLGFWDFESGSSCDTQGWVSVDATQGRLFAHVDDFAGLGGGDFGHLMPLEGNQSLWLGARPDGGDPDLCSYLALPGYGNSWDQGFCTACLNVAGDVVLDYIIRYDTEPGYDIVRIRYDECDGNPVDLRSFSGYQFSTLTDVVPAASHAGQVSLQFWFQSDGAWSDQDGMWNTDGAFIVDSVTVSDAGGVLLGTELFETEAVGDQTTTSGNWSACGSVGYGDFAGLFNGTMVVQEDPCNSNLSCMWGFFNGSTYNYACGGFPQQLVVPYKDANDQYIANYVESPLVPVLGAGSQYGLEFDVYEDLALNALIYYRWDIRNVGPDGCPRQWKDLSFVYFGNFDAWARRVFNISTLIDSDAVNLQVRLGVVDQCQFWCGTVGTGDCHSHAPLFDNVELYRVDSQGPVWYARDIDLFQDNFAEDGTTTGTVRADMANDILPDMNLNIRPGDSTVVQVWDPEHGLGADAYTGFGSSVYLYVGIWPQGQPGKDGTALTQDLFRFPVVDSLTHNGDTWYCMRMDTAFTSPARIGHLSNGFCADLNDNLFTPGDTVCFTFCAENSVGERTYWNVNTGTTDNLGLALDNADEFTCLPTQWGYWFYVDGFDGRGAQPFFDTTFDMYNMTPYVDRFDIRGPSSNVGNSPGGRVKDVFQQMMAPYQSIIWDTGDLEDGLIGDGTGMPDKADDALLLSTWLANLPKAPSGIYFSGDNIASELTTLAGPSVTSLRSYIGFTLVSDDHKTLGLGTNPLGVGVPGGCFLDPVGMSSRVDTLVAFGGCPTLSNFDVIAPSGAARLEMNYHGNGMIGGAVVGQHTLNLAGFDVGVGLAGFSFYSIRDDAVPPNVFGVPDRGPFLYHMLTCYGDNNNALPVDVPGRTPSRYHLAQNYPNPFNPITTIKYEVKTQSHVTLRIYNVTGQLVRTLVNESVAPGTVHAVDWNGRNDAGVSVSSGVYFYRLSTPEFTQTKKMVLLK